jgi:hypothetical protein
MDVYDVICWIATQSNGFYTCNHSFNLRSVNKQVSEFYTGNHSNNTNLELHIKQQADL